MTSRKRWERIYTLENPFRLPQSLMRALKKCSRLLGCQKPEKVRYLWIHLNDEAIVPRQLRDQADCGELAAEDWFNVIDESAALGAETLVVSMGCPISERPDVWDICEWAQKTYGMSVGIYVCNGEMSPEDVERLASLEPQKTRLFVDSEHLDKHRHLEERGVCLCVADGLMPGETAPSCHLPESMTCVGSGGTLYTCGLVLGQEHYKLGYVARERLDKVMADASLPHHIPGGLSDAPRRCNACPPLMERKMRGVSSGH